jgi:IPT/TIG domain
MPRETRTSVVGAILIALLVLALAPAAGAARAGFRVASVCRAPAPGRAGCLAKRLLPSTLNTARASANKELYRRAAARHERLPALRKTPYPGFLTPERLHAAYSLPATTAAGATQTVAVVDAFDDPTAEADLAVYDQQFGLGECTTANGCFKKIDQQGKASPLPEVEGGWASEISIDVQMARAICQSCKILLVETDSEEFSDLGAGVNAAAKAGATVISNSYGGPELGEYASLASADYDHPGVVVAASSGDCGYLNKACKGDPQKANFPASFQDVVSVGGTSMTESAGVWTSTVWSEGGSGCSTIFSAPLWESGVAGFAATGCKTGRAVADVAAIGDPNTGVDVYDSTPEGLGAATGWGVWGGTSVASPIVAAEYALAGGAHGVEYPASTLYPHLGQVSYLYDVTAGSNGSCASATICKAAAGFDGPTGVGSPLSLGAFAAGEAPVDNTSPTIAGSAVQEGVLTASPGTWSGAPSSFDYQWERCEGSTCSPIAGATGSSHTVSAGDVGAKLRVLVWASNGTGTGGPAASGQTTTVASNQLSIASFTPSGITGSTIAIEGSGFEGTTQVLVGKLAAAFTVVSPTELEAVVPNGAASGKLAVTTAHGSTKSKGRFTVTLSIKSFKPGTGAVGTTVTIKGVGFNGSSVVRFDGTPASVVSSSSSKLKVTVPAGATTGPITVTNSSAPVGTVRSAGEYTP